MRHAESRIQSMCVAWFRLQYRSYAPLYFAVPNGVATSATQARILKGEGLLAGVADTLLLVPSQGYHGLCIEFKKDTTVWKEGQAVRAKTYQRPEQKEWQKAVEAQGYRYEVVRSFEEFKDIITNYLAAFVI